MYYSRSKVKKVPWLLGRFKLLCDLFTSLREGDCIYVSIVVEDSMSEYC